MRQTLTLVAAIPALLMACGASQEASNREAATRAAQGQPVESRPPNGTGQQPAFEGQTRAPGVTTERALNVQTVTEGLDHPWALEPMPNGHWLVTERAGRLRVIDARGAIIATVDNLPAIVTGGQAGLFDVALSPDFETDRLIYFTYAEPREDGNGLSVGRGRLSEDERTLEDFEQILRTEPSYNNTMHYGGRLAFDRNGYLFVTLGERSDRETRPEAQVLGSHFGKILRIRVDGTVPEDNPFLADGHAMPEVWSLGHRNVQGAALNPSTGELWAVEHGARGGDEVNIVRAGRNYGWPIIAYGMEYRGGAIGEGLTAREGLEQPIYYWDPVIATGGMAFYQGDLFPEWRGNLFVSGLAGRHLARLVLDGERVVGEERLLTDQGQRIRDVAVAADGSVWVVTDEDNGLLMRITPAG